MLIQNLKLSKTLLLTISLFTPIYSVTSQHWCSKYVFDVIKVYKGDPWMTSKDVSRGNQVTDNPLILFS